jgi:myo-inositol catabolism protein IolH
MKIALDPWMIRDRSLTDVCRFAADAEYEWIELSPRDDFLPLFVGPRANRENIAELKKALKDYKLGLASLWTVYRWAEPGNADARETAVRYWKRAIEVAKELECRHLNSEFSGNPEAPEESEAAFWRSMDELVPILERENITLALEPHPGDFVENGNQAADIIRAIGSPRVKYLYCAPHTFHMGGDLAGMIRHAASVLDHVHVADTFDHRQPVRYIVNPPGAPVRIHQHLNIGEGEIDWDVFFQTLAEVKYDGILTNSVFAWPDKPEASALIMLQKIKEFLVKQKPLIHLAEEIP